jgi:radical SAM superfamily enzyme YgiQ (UPF0313 family)
MRTNIRPFKTDRDTPHILLVNPWIHDFAAYDFWAKPIGLLYLAAVLREHGYRVSYIDCLDRFHPRAARVDPGARFGRGPYLKIRIPKPRGLEDVPRIFSRYGIRPEWFTQDLQSMIKPDLVLITSMMTYWCGGVKETIEIIRSVFPETPVVLGGIYANLCYDHARRFAGADRVFSGQGEAAILEIAGNHTGFRPGPRFDPVNPDTYPLPAFDLQNRVSYIPILTSRGCPFSCAYCASRFLNPHRQLRDASLVADEIRYWNGTYGVLDFAFYDDALLVDAERHAALLFEKIIDANLGIRLHTPNAVHIREITNSTALLMKAAGFETIRLGLETAAFEDRHEMDRKVTETEFKRAVSCLKDAGFDKKQVGAYLLVGLPGQSITSVLRSIDMIKQYGITPVPAHYSPIPHTVLWERAVAASRYDLEANPVFSNNAVFPCSKEPFSWDVLTRLKDRIALDPDKGSDI